MLKDVPPPRMQIMCLQIFIKKKKKKGPTELQFPTPQEESIEREETLQML